MATLKPLFFDIETVANYELSDEWMARRPKPEPEGHLGDDLDALRRWQDEQLKEMALQPEACKLVGLNVIIGDGEPKSGWAGEMSPKGELYTEGDLLVLFWSWAAQCPRLIGFNCNRFDLHVIRVRSALLGVAPTINLFDIKPWEEKVIDLLERRFKGTPYSQFLSLKALRSLLHFEVPEKYQEVLANTGGDVESLYLRFLAGDDDALRLLKLYGELDVLTTKMLAQMWQGYYFSRFE